MAAQELTSTRKLPAQRLTYAEKVKNNFEYFRKTADYYINSATFKSVRELDFGYVESNEIDKLIGLYNNDIPAEWFDHILHPIGEEDFLPAKVRPFNILKTNIDFLLSNKGKRPLQFTVVNNGEGAYNQMLEEKKKFIDTVKKQRFKGNRLTIDTIVFEHIQKLFFCLKSLIRTYLPDVVIAPFHPLDKPDIQG